MNVLNLKLVVIIVENNNCTEKDDYVYKNDMPPYQKLRIFITSKGVGLSLELSPSRKYLKGLSQNI